MSMTIYTDADLLRELIRRRQNAPAVSTSVQGYKDAVENLRKARDEVRTTLGAQPTELTRQAAERVVAERDELKAFIDKIEQRMSAVVKAELAERQRGGGVK